MPTEHAIPILLTMFTVLTIAGICVPLAIFVPRHLESRRVRSIDQMTQSAAVLAAAIARNQGNPGHRDRLMANYQAHATALGQLGQPVPPLA